MSAPEIDYTDHGERLDRARTRMRDALLGAVQLLAPLGAQSLRDALDELQAAWADYEDALTDRVTALILNRDLANKTTQERNRERIAVIEEVLFGQRAEERVG